MQILGEEAMHQKSLREIPRTDQVERMLVVGEFGQAGIADHPADTDSDRLVEIEAVDGVAVLLGRQ
jgi:hypothetical protein